MPNEAPISPEIINIVVARLNTLPSNIRISVGSKGTFNVRELIERVRENDEVGETIVKMQMLYIKALQDLPVPEHEGSNYEAAT
jgi:hypothetical protein